MSNNTVNNGYEKFNNPTGRIFFKFSKEKNKMTHLKPKKKKRKK